MKELSDIEVSNVYIYVADAVRWDALSEYIAERGLSIKSIAASIHTPTSFASILTGRYLPSHGVYDFTNSISTEANSLLDLPGTNTAFVNSINNTFNTSPQNESIIAKTLCTENSSHETMESIDPPFLVVERGRGGHAPYGRFEGNAWEYFRKRGSANVERYRSEYREGIEADVQWFHRQLSVLEERGILDDTLVIYTSDHGELLGECGSLGHNSPIHPKLVYVPTVFIHPSIRDSSIDSGAVRAVDISPTVASLLSGGKTYSTHSGVDLTENSLRDRGGCFYSKRYSGPVSGRSLSYGSVWDRNGGYVYAESPLVDRMIVYAGKCIKSPKRAFLRANVTESLRSYLHNTREYGTPKFTGKEAERIVSTLYSETSLPLPERNDVDATQLRDLGYLN